MRFLRISVAAVTSIGLLTQAGAPALGQAAATECESIAISTDAESWFCTPFEFVYVDQTGETNTLELQPSESLTHPIQSRAIGDDYNSWCENIFNAICHRVMSPWVEETKANAQWGNQNGALGTLDFILRNNFNGASARYTLTVIVDNGPAVLISPTVTTRQISPISRSLPTNFWGAATVSDRIKFPLINDAPATNAGKYQAQVGGILDGPGINPITISGFWNSVSNCLLNGSTGCVYP
jgi:hypothetical protein